MFTDVPLGRGRGILESQGIGIRRQVCEVSWPFFLFYSSRLRDKASQLVERLIDQKNTITKQRQKIKDQLDTIHEQQKKILTSNVFLEEQEKTIVDQDNKIAVLLKIIEEHQQTKKRAGEDAELSPPVSPMGTPRAISVNGEIQHNVITASPTSSMSKSLSTSSIPSEELKNLSDFFNETINKNSSIPTSLSSPTTNSQLTTSEKNSRNSLSPPVPSGNSGLVEPSAEFSPVSPRVTAVRSRVRSSSLSTPTRPAASSTTPSASPFSPLQIPSPANSPSIPRPTVPAISTKPQINLVKSPSSTTSLPLPSLSLSSASPSAIPLMPSPRRISTSGKVTPRKNVAATPPTTPLKDQGNDEEGSEGGDGVGEGEGEKGEEQTKKEEKKNSMIKATSLSSSGDGIKRTSTSPNVRKIREHFFSLSCSIHFIFFSDDLQGLKLSSKGFSLDAQDK